MRPLLAAAAAVTLACAAPAAAQVSNHGIALESGVSSALGTGAAPRATFAVAASTWLEGEVEGVARIAYGSAAGTGGRAAASALSGTLGLRVSLGHGALRPQLFADAGWARVEADGMLSDRAAFGAGGALEWFPAADVSIAPRLTLRLVGAEARAELGLALGGYF